MTRMNESQNGRGTSSNGEDDEDRKPPARVYIRKKCSEEENDDNDDEDGDEGIDATVFTSTQTSLASPSSSVNQMIQQQPYSPVARRQQSREGEETDDEEEDEVNIVLWKRTPLKSKQRRKKKGSLFSTPLKENNVAATVPKLTAATPFTPDQSVVPKTSREIQSSTNSQQLNSLLTSLRYQITLWIVTITVTVVVFLSQVLPATALAALLFGVASTGMFTQTMILALRRLYYEIVFHGNGLADFLRLPESLIRTLTQTTIHEYMTDPSFMLEYRHMALYFLPLSEQQLELSIAQLAPQHRDRLYRPAGIGRALLGDDMMRVLMGENRWRRTMQNERTDGTIVTTNTNTTSTTRIPTVSATRQQRILLLNDDNNDDSETESSDTRGLDVMSDDRIINSARMNDEQAVNVVARLGLDSDNPNTATPTMTPVRVVTTIARNSVPRQQQEETVEQFADRELQVLVDAMWGSLYGSVLYPIRDYVSSSIVVPTVTTVSTAWMRLGIGLTFGSIALGVWGFWSGIYSWPSMSMSIGNARAQARERMRYPNSETVWTTAIWSGASVGLALFARQYARYYFQNSEGRRKADEDVSKSPPREE